MLKKYNVSKIQSNVTHIQCIQHAFILYSTTQKIKQEKIQHKIYNTENINTEHLSICFFRSSLRLMFSLVY